MVSKVSAICCASYAREPLKSRCSMKCETPARSSRSSREPAAIQKPIATERTLATRSEITRSPESSSESTYFCTSANPSRGRALPLRREAKLVARPLRLVERRVGGVEERLGLRGVGGEGSGAEAGPHAREDVARLRHRRPHALDDGPHRLGRRVGEDERELVASEPERLVRAPHRGSEDPA